MVKYYCVKGTAVRTGKRFSLTKKGKWTKENFIKQI